MSGDLLARLQAARSDEEREWLVLQFNLESLDPALREAAQAAAIPHWFDAEFLAVILDRPADETRPLFERLIALSFVEPFPGRGHDVHERTRALLLNRLWQDDRERYREWSRRAAAYCERRDRSDPAWRIEAI